MIVIYALRPIEAIEELLLDYRLDAADCDAPAFSCKCLAARCRDTMVAVVVN